MLTQRVGVQLCLGINFDTNLQIGTVYAHAEAIKCYNDGGGLCFFEPYLKEEHPLMHLLHGVHVLVQE